MVHRESCGPQPGDERVDARGEMLEAGGEKLHGATQAHGYNDTEVFEMGPSVLRNGQLELCAREQRGDWALHELVRIGKLECIPLLTSESPLGGDARNELCSVKTIRVRVLDFQEQSGIVLRGSALVPDEPWREHVRRSAGCVPEAVHVDMCMRALDNKTLPPRW